MTSAWTGKPCQECGKKKGPKQRDLKFCWTCGRGKKKAASAAAHGKRVEETYGITEADYWALYEFQGGRCYICRWASGKTRRLCVDHDHSCTVGHARERGCPVCVRGLLCRSCNTIIGRARDAIAFFQRAIEYLTNPPWRQLRKLRGEEVD